MFGEKELWGEVRSWAHGTYTDDIDKLSMLESIFERSDVPIDQVEGLGAYLSTQLEPYAPRASTPRKPEVMRAWLSGQLVHVLSFMLPDVDVFELYGEYDIVENSRTVERYLRGYPRSPWEPGHLVLARGSVGLDSQEDICNYVAEELGGSSLRMAKARSDGTTYPGEEDWRACLEHGFYWKKRIYQYAFESYGVRTSYGLDGGYKAVVYIKRDDTLVEVRGPWEKLGSPMALFELLAHIGIRFPKFEPSFQAPPCQDAFDNVWAFYRTLRWDR